MRRRALAPCAIMALVLCTPLAPAWAESTALTTTLPPCAASQAQVAPLLAGNWTLETVATRVSTQMGSKRGDGAPPEPVTLLLEDGSQGTAQIGANSFDFGIHPPGGLAMANYPDHFRAFADAAKAEAKQAAAATVNCALRDLPQVFATLEGNGSDTRLEMIMLGPDLLAGALVTTVPAKTDGASPNLYISSALLRRTSDKGE